MEKKNSTFNKLRINARKIKTMKVGETRVFTELDYKPPGSHTQAVATQKSIRMKVTTQTCWIIVPRTQELIKAVIVTREDDKFIT